jgi:hypothetical protein
MAHPRGGDRQRPAAAETGAKTQNALTGGQPLRCDSFQ